jgi:hypothetical protein
LALDRGYAEVLDLQAELAADTTPYSPGTDDKASGVGSILGLAERLASEPPRHTEVWIVTDGYEELRGTLGIRCPTRRTDLVQTAWDACTGSSVRCGGRWMVTAIVAATGLEW